MKHWRAKRGRPFVMARHSLKIIKLWEKEFEVTLSCVRFVSQWYEHYQYSIGSIIDHISDEKATWYRVWYSTYHWTRLSVYRSAQPWSQLLPLVQDPPQCCISWRLFLGIRRAPSDQVMTLWRMQHTISAISNSAPSFLSICFFMDQQRIDPLPRTIIHHWT